MGYEDLPATVRSTLSECDSWTESGLLEFSPKWKPISDAKRLAPATSGIYALGLPCGLSYPNADSRIVYIGSSNHLRRRLAAHYPRPQNEVIKLLLETFPGELLVTLWPISNLSNRWLRGFEGEALWEFGRSFGTTPLCNLDIPVSSVSDRCDDCVRVMPCKRLETPLTLEQLAERSNRVLVISEASPIGDPNEVVVKFGFVRNESGKLMVGQTNLCNAVRLLTREEARQLCTVETSAGEGIEETKETHWFVGQLNLAAWSIEKMKAVIELCNTLTARKTKAKTVCPFDAPFREVPVPHTWGEVALIQSRIVSESWQPDKNVWVKVMFDKELLGQGKLNSSGYFGEDISDLPQTMRERLTCTEFDVKNRSFVTDEDGTILECEFKDGSPIYRTISKTIEQITTEQEREEQQRDEQMQAKVEGLFAEAMNQVAYSPPRPH